MPAAAELPAGSRGYFVQRAHRELQVASEIRLVVRYDSQATRWDEKSSFAAENGRFSLRVELLEPCGIDWFFGMVGRVGLEPTTNALKGRCSTN